MVVYRPMAITVQDCSERRSDGGNSGQPHLMPDQRTAIVSALPIALDHVPNEGQKRSEMIVLAEVVVGGRVIPDALEIGP